MSQTNHMFIKNGLQFSNIFKICIQKNLSILYNIIGQNEDSNFDRGVTEIKVGDRI